MPASPPASPESILATAMVPDGVWRGEVATEMELSVDMLLLGKDPAML